MDDSLLAAVIANKGDDLPRQIYADYLDEHGEAEHAEFIRCELASTKIGGCLTPENLGCSCEYCELKNRASWLLHPLEDVSLARKPAQFLDEFTKLQTSSQVFTRGFVSRITLPIATWIAHGLELMKLNPLELVQLTNCSQILRRQVSNSWEGIEFEYIGTDGAIDILQTNLSRLGRLRFADLANHLATFPALKALANDKKAVLADGARIQTAAGELLEWKHVTQSYSFDPREVQASSRDAIPVIIAARRRTALRDLMHFIENDFNEQSGNDRNYDRWRMWILQSAWLKESPATRVPGNGDLRAVFIDAVYQWERLPRPAKALEQVFPWHGGPFL